MSEKTGGKPAEVRLPPPRDRVWRQVLLDLPGALPDLVVAEKPQPGRFTIVVPDRTEEAPLIVEEGPSMIRLGFDFARAYAGTMSSLTGPFCAAPRIEQGTRLVQAVAKRFPKARPAPGAPSLVYTVDVEAGGYSDGRLCLRSDGGEPGRDTRMCEALPTMDARFRAQNIRPTYFVDLGTADERDLAALGAARFAEVGLHQGEPGVSHADFGDWVQAGDGRRVRKNLERGLATLQRAGHAVKGIRLPRFHQSPAVLALLEEAGLEYDSSQLVGSPESAFPYRVWKRVNGEPHPTRLIGLPAIVATPLTNQLFKEELPSRVRWTGLPGRLVARARGKKRMANLLEGIIALGGEAVVCMLDHDMTVGANPAHRHGNWKFDPSGFDLLTNWLRPCRSILGTECVREWHARREGRRCA
ncbi:MAG: hypothetical protein ACYTAF_14255 [Planctomycetota bacterium]